MNIDEILTAIIKFVIIPLIMWAGVTIIKLLDAWIASIKSERLRIALASARIELSKAIKDSVSFVQQTFVAALADPTKLTKEQAAEAFRLAAKRVEAIMSEVGWKVLEDASVVINDLIQAQIEATIPVVKAEAVADKQAVVDLNEQLRLVEETIVPSEFIPSH